MQMNIIIENIPLIASALEFYDQKTGAAWRLRTAIVGAVVWAAHRMIKLEEAAEPETVEEAYKVGSDEAGKPQFLSSATPEIRRLQDAATAFHTLLAWANDAQEYGFPLDMTGTGIGGALGLSKKFDAHAEAVNVARNKCMRARSAKRFKEFYASALDAVSEQRKDREELVSAIEARIDEGAAPNFYDEEVVSLQAERLEEAMCSAVESTWQAAKLDLFGALSPTRITRASSAVEALEKMGEILGIRPKKLESCNKALSEQLEKAQAEVDADAKKLDAEMKAMAEAA
jgi:hypothetical protein